MRTRSIRIIVFSLCALLTACETAPRDPNLTRDSKWIGGLSGGVVSFEARKVDDRTYDIIAYGAGACSEQQVIEGWVWMANKLAKGMAYEKETQTERYEYDAPAPMGSTHHVGKKVFGRMVLK